MLVTHLPSVPLVLSPWQGVGVSLERVCFILSVFPYNHSVRIAGGVVRVELAAIMCSQRLQPETAQTCMPTQCQGRAWQHGSITGPVRLAGLLVFRLFLQCLGCKPGPHAFQTIVVPLNYSPRPLLDFKK